MKYFLFFLLYVLFFQLSVFAQRQSYDAGNEFNKLFKSVIDEYGLDQVLVNGVLYEDKYMRKTGHQFLFEDQLYKGTLIFRGKEYKGLEMKYDIFEQQILLCIKRNNSMAFIVPPNDFISAFSLGDIFFSKYNFEGEPGFYQEVVITEKLKCLYYWSKEKIESASDNKYVSYEFKYREKKKFLVLNGTYLPYRKNKSFIELFPEAVKSAIRHYLKTNHIKIAKCSDEKMVEILTYCNSLL